jgi:hypothetical protein
MLRISGEFPREQFPSYDLHCSALDLLNKLMYCHIPFLLSLASISTINESNVIRWAIKFQKLSWKRKNGGSRSMQETVRLSRRFPPPQAGSFNLQYSRRERSGLSLTMPGTTRQCEITQAYTYERQEVVRTISEALLRISMDF